MAREKKQVHKVEMTEAKRNIVRQLLEEYEIETAKDIREALKDLLGNTIREIMEAEMTEHLGYQKSERCNSEDYRNRYKPKQVNSSYGSIEIQVPQDRKCTLCEVYPVVFIDAIHYSVRDNRMIRKLVAYVMLDINLEGRKEGLTIQVGENESLKYWLSILNSLKNRGIKDILILYADGLTGIKEAISADRIPALYCASSA